MSADGDEARAARRAAEFVARHGDARAGLRARALADAHAAAALRAALEAEAPEWERRDGWVAAEAALEILAEQDALAGPLAERACAAVVRAQEADGSWPGADAAEAARIARTGLIAGLLARTRFARPRALHAAGSYLALRWTPARVRDGLPVVAGVLRFCANAGGDDAFADMALHACGRELERGWREGAWDAAAVARVFVDCDAASLPGTALRASELRAGIAALQAADGGLGARDEPIARRVARTLDALVAWARLPG